MSRAEKNRQHAVPRNGRLRRFLQNLLLIVFGIAIPCIAGELLLRAVSPPADTPGLFEQVDASNVAVLGKPMAAGVFAGAKVKFNSIGLRDAEFSRERRPGVGRIIILGDSITFGQGVAQDLTYPKRTEAILNASVLSKYDSVEILNFGIPGYNTINELAQLRAVGLQFNPDIVLVGFLYNDTQPISDGRQPERISGAKERFNAIVSWWKRRSKLFAYLSPRVGRVVRKFAGQEFGQTGAFKYQYEDANEDWRKSREALLEIKKLGEEFGFEVGLLILPAMDNCVENEYPLLEYHQALGAFSAANGISYVDVLDAFWGIDARQFWISPTDGHPNAQGHEIIARSVAEFLQGRLGGL